ncbi:peptidoglycan-binding domain-containing protein [Rhizobium johnstonii]|nr:peptidoglycan-binding domain-containing protein [Rhizobium johnstonii]
MTIQAKFSVLAMACMFCAISTGQVHAEIRPVRDVQKALADQGFDAGSPDGIWGSKSVAALKGFQRAHGLTPSGVVTQDSLKALFPAREGRTANAGRSGRSGRGTHRAFGRSKA